MSSSSEQRSRPRQYRGDVEAGTLKRTPLYEAHVEAGAKLVPFAGWEMPVSYEGIRAEHLRGADLVRGLRRLAHGRDRDRGPAGGRACCSACSPTTSPRSRSAAPSTPASAARTAGCSTISSPTGSASDRYLTVTNAANHERDLEWFERARRSTSRSRSATGSPTTRCSRSRARRPARSSRGSPTASCPRASGPPSSSWPAAPALVCGTGYTGEDGVELLVAPEERAGPSGTRCSAAARRPPGSARATRCGSRSATASTATS